MLHLQKGETMKNIIIDCMAFIGFVIIIGAVGTMDYKMTVHEYYPLAYTLVTMLIGILLCTPAIIREVR